MKKTSFVRAMKIGVALLPLFIIFKSAAHSRWVVPSHTILSGEEPESVAFDLSISNDIFHPDMAFGGVNLGANPKAFNSNKYGDSIALFAIAPNGEKARVPLVNLKRKSSGSYLLDQSGSYRFTVEQPDIFITVFKNAKGEKDRRFGRFVSTKEKLPKTATDIKEIRIINTIETYVTRNQTSALPINSSRRGLQMRYLTHPNELFVGETAKFELLWDGKPVAEGTAIKLTRAGTRYRNERKVQEVHTGARGDVAITWSKPGQYLLEADITKPGSNSSDKDVYTIFVTLEVNPE